MTRHGSSSNGEYGKIMMIYNQDLDTGDISLHIFTY